MSNNGHEDTPVVRMENIIKRFGTITALDNVDYTVEKNGVLFPGRQLVQEIFFRNSKNGFQQMAVKRETRFEYDAYRFFVVETDVRYKKEE